MAFSCNAVFVFPFYIHPLFAASSISRHSIKILCVFRGIILHITGDMKPALKRICDGFLDEMQKRFSNRPILGRLGWLDISNWPANEHALELHGLQDLKRVFEHWQHRFPSVTWALNLTK